MEKWAYCIPEGMTREEYLDSISSESKSQSLANNNNNNRSKLNTLPKNNNNNRSKLNTLPKNNNNNRSKLNTLANNNNNNRSKLNTLPKNNNNNRSKLNTLPKNNNNRSKLKKIITVNYKYSPKTRKRLLSKQAKRGTCIFPFKNKKYSDPLQYDCVKGKDDSSWCATKVKPNLLKEEWGYCVPEGMTEAEYNRMYEN